MKRVKPTMFYARPAVILVAIISLCLCSVFVSIYYVHNFAVTPLVDLIHEPHDMKLPDNHELKGALHLPPSSTSRPHQEKPAMVIGKAVVLNNIDFASHIEERKKEIVAENEKVKERNSKQVKRKKIDQWPQRRKIYKKERQEYTPLENQTYNVSVRTKTNWNGERYIVYLCHSNLTCAGWGDRQHGIFSAYLLSMMTNRTFKVDMQSPCPLEKLYHPRKLNWKVDKDEFKGLTSTHVYVLNDRKFRDSLKTLNFNSAYPQDVVYITTNYDYYYGLKSNPVYKEVFKKKVRNRPRPILFSELWQTYFKFNKRVIRRYNTALEKASPTPNHKLVCAHIRFGRNPSIPTDGDVRNTLVTIKPLWEFLKQYADPSRYRLFIASDWEGFLEKVHNHFKHMSIQVSGDVIHIDKLKGFQNNSSTDFCKGFEKVIADQYVLTRCDILLLTYSVFGKAAAYIRKSNKDLYILENGQIKPLMLFNEKNIAH